MDHQRLSMILESNDEKTPRTTQWAGRIGLVLESPELVLEISQAVGEMGADSAFRAAVGAPVFEVAGLVERERADLVFVELAQVKAGAAEWIDGVRAGGVWAGPDMPLVVAVHPTPEPSVMIEAMRGSERVFEFAGAAGDF
jgi:hypothetical protein